MSIFDFQMRAYFGNTVYPKVYFREKKNKITRSANKQMKQEKHDLEILSLESCLYHSYNLVYYPLIRL